MISNIVSSLNKGFIAIKSSRQTVAKSNPFFRIIDFTLFDIKCELFELRDILNLFANNHKDIYKMKTSSK